MTPGTQLLVAWGIRIVLVLALVGFVLHGCGKLDDLLGAKAELASSRGDQAAGKAAVDGQAAAIKGLQTEGERRKAESEKAVKSAGKGEFAAAAKISATPAAGSTAVERAVNRINSELGQ